MASRMGALLHREPAAPSTPPDASDAPDADAATKTEPVVVDDAAAAAAADDDEETIFFVFFFFFEANVEDAVGDDDGFPARASGRALMNAESAATNPDATVRAADESAFPMPACGTARRRSGAGRRKIQPRGSDLV